MKNIFGTTEELKQKREDLKLIESDIKKIQVKLDSLYERKKHLDSHKYNEDCNICMENSTTIRGEKAKVESAIQDGNSYIQEKNDEKLKLSLQIESLV
jgi:prefoldin subunit 5